MPSTLRRSFWIPRPLVALVVLLVVVSTAFGAWTYTYAQKRLAAIAYVKNNRGSVTFAASPGWWPEKVPLPEWLKSVASVYPGNKRPCDMAKIKALHEVQRLDCVGGTLDDAQLQSIGHFRQVKRLHLLKSSATEIGLKSLQQCRRLEWMSISLSEISDQTLSPLEKVAGEKRLSLTGCRLTEPALQSLSHVPRVTFLDVTDTDLDDAGLALLADLPVEWLNLTGTRISDAGLKHLARMPLRRLKLTRTRITDAGLADLKPLPLETLDVSQTEIMGMGLLALEGMRTLETVYVDESQLTPRSTQSLKSAGVPVEIRPRTTAAGW